MIKQFITFGFLSGLFCAYHSAFAEKNADIKSKIQALVHYEADDAYVGHLVKSLHHGTVLSREHDTHLFVPASNIKLFTAAAALAQLGKDFQFDTALYTNKKDKKSIDDLYIRFSGDPSLTLKSFDKLLKTLRQKGIKKIEGNIFIDNTVFDSDPYGPGWMIEDKPFCFSAPVNGIILDKNCFIARFTGTRYHLKIDRHDVPEDITFNSQVKYLKKAPRGCKLTTDADASNKYTFKGCLTPNDVPYSLELAIQNVESSTQGHILQALSRYRIRHRKNIQILKKTPDYRKYTLLEKHQSQPLKVLLTDLLENSDNMIAEALLKKLGHLYSKGPGSWKNGIKALYAILKRHYKIDLSDTKIVDGSGTSRYNLVTPQSLASLLEAVYFSQYRQTFLDALPRSGLDGKWFKDRFSRFPKLHQQIFAKTGTMSGITSLAGYMPTTPKGPILFVVISNNFKSRMSKYKLFENKFCNLVFNCMHDKC